MSIAIITSSKDSASITIFQALLRTNKFELLENETDQYESIHQHKEDTQIKLYHLKEMHVLADDLDIKANYFIFGSRHRSKENTPAFTVHSIGNWGDADTGKSKHLCPSPARLQRALFLALTSKQESKPDYSITQEATHHGPHTSTPSVFVEIGSTDKEWEDQTNGDLIAQSMLEGIQRFQEDTTSIPTLILGGSHYPQMGDKLVKRTRYAVGHICPKYQLELLTPDLIKQALQNTIPTPELIVLDWKGLGQQKQHVLDMLEELNITHERGQRLLKQN